MVNGALRTTRARLLLSQSRARLDVVGISGFPVLDKTKTFSSKAPFGVEVDPLDKDTTRYFPLATVANRTTG